MPGPCLTDDDYHGVLADSLPADARVRVAIHVSECEECRVALEERRLLGLATRPSGSAVGTGSVSATSSAGRSGRRWRVGIPWALVVVLLVLSVYVSLQLTSVIERQGRQIEVSGDGVVSGSRAEWEAELHRDRMRLARAALDEASPRLLQDLLSGAPESARGWAWQHLHALSDRATSRRWVGAGGVTAFVSSLVGRDIIGGRDGHIRVSARDRRDQALDWQGHDGAVVALSLSPDGQTIASGGDDQKIHLWRCEDGSLLRTLEGHSWSVLQLAFAPDGETLVSASRDETLRIWRVADGSVVRTLEGHGGAVHAVAVTDRGIASGGEDGRLLLWGAQESPPMELGSAGDAVLSLIDVHGFLACGRASGVVQVWDLDERRLAGAHREHRHGVVAFALAGGVLASADDGGTIVTWDVASKGGNGDPLDGGEWVVRATLRGHRGAVSGLRFTGDGAVLRSGGEDDAVCTWDPALRDGWSRPLHCGAVEWCHQAGTVFLVGCEHGVVQLWDIKTWQQIDAAPTTEEGRILDLDGSGQRVLIRADDGSLGVRRITGEVLLDAGIADLGALSPTGLQVALWRDGALVTAAIDGSGKERILAQELSDVRELVFSPLGDWLGCRRGDASVVLWSLGEDVPLEPTTLVPAGGAPVQMAFSVAATRVVTVGPTGAIDVFDLPGGEGSRFAERPADASAELPRQQCVAFGPGGSRVVAGDDAGNLVVWDAEYGHELLRWKAHEEAVTHVGFLGETRLFSIGRDGTLRIWWGKKPAP